MSDKDFRKQCLQCKRLLPQVYVCVNGGCDERYMTLICELCHKDLHNNLNSNEQSDAESVVRQVHLHEFLAQIQTLIDRESSVDHASKSEVHAKVVEQIDSSVATVDEIINRLEVVRSNLLNIREQVTNPSAQAKTIYDNLQISTSSYQQIILSLQQLKSFAQVDAQGTALALKELGQTNTVVEVAETQSRVDAILHILQQSSQQSNQQQQLTKEALKAQALEKVNNHLKTLNTNLQFGSFERIKIQYDYYQRGYYIDDEYIAYFSDRYQNAQELYKYWLSVNTQIEAAQF